MAKRNKKQVFVEKEQLTDKPLTAKLPTEEQAIETPDTLSSETRTAQNIDKLDEFIQQSDTAQAVKSQQHFAEISAKSSLNSVSDEGENVAEKIDTTAEHNEPEMATDAHENDVNAEQTEKQKSGGKGIALLALLIALGVGGAGYYFGLQKFNATEQRLSDVQASVQQQIKQFASNGASGNGSQTAVEIPTFEAEKAQIAKLEGGYEQALAQINQLSQQLSQQQASYEQQLKGLQSQLQKVGAGVKADPSAWLLSDADFLLTNALRKIVIDYDMDTAKSLLIEADNALSQVDDSQITAVREALKADLNNLISLNQVDQNNVMQRLAQLANLVDDMPMLDNEQLAVKESGNVSDSIDDWQKNLEKSADSFLSHFIRVSDKKQVQDKAFIAPNQEVYLRENIRLRLQIAILAVPRQQNELYKQSLEAVSTWVRSYFDVQSDVVKTFLKDVDDLIEQSIYIDAPTKLQSLDLLKQKLNRQAPDIQKMELEVGKDVQQMKIDQPVQALEAEKSVPSPKADADVSAEQTATPTAETAPEASETSEAQPTSQEQPATLQPVEPKPAEPQSVEQPVEKQ